MPGQLAPFSWRHFGIDQTFSGLLFIKIETDVNPNVIGVLFQAIKEIEAKTLIRFKMLSNETDGIQPGGDIICQPYQFDGRDSEVKELFLDD